MSADPVMALREALTAQGIDARPGVALLPARALTLPPAAWGEAARITARAGWRWSGLWGEELGPGLRLNALLVRGGAYGLLRTELDPAAPALPSQTPFYPAANRPERHVRDLLGVHFDDHPDPRRWTRHGAWGEGAFPLRRDFPAGPGHQGPTPGDSGYPFIAAHGAGVHEIPVGPVHAGIIEPGHFRFLAVGEEVLNLEERLGYVHKGIEKLAAGRDGAGLARLAGRVSGDATVSHAWAACQAMERAAGLEPPPRAVWLRAILGERERVANHLGDIGAICNDVGFAFAQYQLTRLREDWLRRNGQVFGHRLLMDLIVPGGLAREPAPDFAPAMADHCRALAAEVEGIVAMLESSDSLEDRLMTTGRLTPEDAQALGVVGYVGKASGVDHDVRRDCPYPPYDGLAVRVPVYRAGDVAARAKVRAEEIGVSLGLIRALLERLPAGPGAVSWTAPGAGAEGLGIVEGWRGETLAYVRFGVGGRIERYFPRDPSWLTWPALEVLIHGNIVPDFPVCNKSVNGSYSGHDL